MNRRNFIKGFSLAPVALLAAPAITPVKVGSEEWWQNLSSNYTFDNRIANTVRHEEPDVSMKKLIACLEQPNQILADARFVPND